MQADAPQPQKSTAESLEGSHDHWWANSEIRWHSTGGCTPAAASYSRNNAAMTTPAPCPAGASAVEIREGLSGRLTTGEWR